MLQTNISTRQCIQEIKASFYHHWLLRYILICADSSRCTFQGIFQHLISWHAKRQMFSPHCQAVLNQSILTFLGSYNLVDSVVKINT